MPRERTLKTDPAYLWDMLDAARTVVELVAGRTFADYERTKMLRLATERAIEIIGEAARNVSDERRARHAAIPWQAIISQRHVLAHEYAEIRNEKVWRVATIHVPLLIPEIEAILAAEPPPP